MPESAFDIYQTARGYVAVTNPVRRQIVQALAGGGLELAELMALTGKAKPTLSSVHLKELIDQGIVDAEAHPDDSRRKVFRLVAKRIGSSEIPLDSLRDAVKEYVSASPLAARFPVSVFFAGVLAAPPDVPPAALRAQARRLGQATGKIFSLGARDDLLIELARFLEQERLARPLRLDLEHGAMEVAYLDGMPPEAEPERVAAVLAGFLDGVAAAKGLLDAPLVVEAVARDRRCTLRLPR